MDTYLIGLDCAAQHPNFGIALGSFGPSGIQIHEVETNNKNVAKKLVEVLNENSDNGCKYELITIGK